VASFDAAVRHAVEAEQQDLLDHPEHCSADAEPLAAIGRALGHQVRIRLAADESTVALYTVTESREEPSPGFVRMGRAGRERLGAAGAFAAVVDSVVPRQNLSDGDAERLGEFVERLRDNGVHRGLIAIAPHGGDIEPHTDVQAERTADRLANSRASTWRCLGFGRDGAGAGRRFHITSTDIHPASFPALGSVMGRGFRYAVAFHGFRDEGVLVGGGAAFWLKAEIASAVEDALSGTGIRVRIAGPDDRFGGDSPRNIVNRLAASRRGGIHIEQSARARAGHALPIADAVAGVFAAHLFDLPRTGPRWWWRLLGDCGR
jgi:phage replication-related protein YjqB (UPF0714/DUF867 family)